MPRHQPAGRRRAALATARATPRPTPPTRRPSSLTALLKDADDPVTRWLRETFPEIPALVQTAAAGLEVQVRPPERDFPYPTVGTALQYRLFMALGGGQALATSVTPAVHGARLLVSQTRQFEQYPFDQPEVGHTGWMSQALAATDEETLARVAFLLALYEEPYRRPAAIARSPLVGRASLDEMLAVVPASVVTDLLAQMELVQPHLDALRALGAAQYGVTPSGAPTVGNAEGDLLLGTCLLEVKATVHPRRELDGALRQLIAYALLDHADQWHLSDVAIYLSRSGHLLTWALPELLDHAAGQPVRLSDLRVAFRAAATIRS